MLKINLMTRTFGVLTALLLFQTWAFAQDSSERQPRPSIRVTGEAVVMAKPDQAEIAIGVVTQAQTAKLAATQNARKLDAVIAALRKTLGQGSEIKTISYSLSPNYRYPKEGGQPVITGYTATNILEVKTGDLDQVGTVIDVATQSGANNIQALRFTLKDEQVVRSQALREAASKAKAKSDALASALGVRITRVLFVEESSPMVRPVYKEMMEARAQAADVSTPVEPGTIEVRAMVTLTVEIAQ